MSQSQFDMTQVFAELTIGESEIHTDNNLAWRPLSLNLVPEPTSGLLDAMALGALAILARSRRSQRERAAGGVRRE